MQEWHAKTKEEIFAELKTSEEGLSDEEASKRLSQFGSNEISKRKKTPLIIEFIKQFHSPLIYILFVAAIISFIFHHLVDAYVILSIVLINATIGFVQERKAERAIDALKNLIVSYAKVIRNGKILKLPSEKVVVGDIIFLEEGDKVPADARIFEMSELRTQESSLTGESFPEIKKIGELHSGVVLADRTNMVFMSTLVVSGEAKAVVVSTANKTAIGQVAKSIQEVVQPKLHFNQKVKQLAFQMAIFALIGAALTFLVGFLLDGISFFEIFLFTIASLVSGIPEGLPAVLIIVLAVGARKMAKRNAVIRHLPAVETLGVATVIATDKTGTLTKNSITTQRVVTFDQTFKIGGDGWEPFGKFFHEKKPINPIQNLVLKKALSISALCNKGNLIKKDGHYEVVGDPTEVSLLVLTKKAGIEKEKSNEKVMDDFPFSSELKLRATLIKTASGKKQVYSVGAFETLLTKSSYILREKGKITMEKKHMVSLTKKAEAMAKQGMRVLALAYKDVPEDVNKVSAKSIDRLVFVSLVGMRDPPRKEIKESIQKAKNAGIRIIIKTGDHEETALAIAKEIGLAEKNSKVLTETELQKMNDLEFRNAVKKVNIYARVSPKMKARIVKALQEQGEIVAMTGDGVNDAPSLKSADIGIAMGLIGTDVARESSEIVLTDDNFASIVNAIEEGRIVFQNVRQTSFYLVTTNVAEDVTIISSLSMGFPLPMLPIQLLYLNLVTDTFNGIALSMESGHNDVLNHPPRNKKERIINKELVPFLFLMAGLMVAGTIPLFAYFLHDGIEKARTVAFVSMSMFQILNVYNMRSLKKSLLKIRIFSNKWITFSVLGSLLLMVAVIYLPFLQTIFRFAPLQIGELALITLIASSILIAGEIFKRIKYKEENK